MHSSEAVVIVVFQIFIFFPQLCTTKAGVMKHIKADGNKKFIEKGHMLHSNVKVYHVIPKKIVSKNLEVTNYTPFNEVAANENETTVETIANNSEASLTAKTMLSTTTQSIFNKIHRKHVKNMKNHNAVKIHGKSFNDPNKITNGKNVTGRTNFTKFSNVFHTRKNPVKKRQSAIQLHSVIQSTTRSPSTELFYTRKHDNVVPTENPAATLVSKIQTEIKTNSPLSHAVGNVANGKRTNSLRPKNNDVINQQFAEKVKLRNNYKSADASNHRHIITANPMENIPISNFESTVSETNSDAYFAKVLKRRKLGNNEESTPQADFTEFGTHRNLSIPKSFVHETQTTVDKKIEQFLEENITLYNNDTFLYANVSKSELKITLPLFKNESFAVYDIEKKFESSSVFKNISYIRGDSGNISFCDFIKRCFTRYPLKIAIGIIIFLLIFCFILLLLCLLKRKKSAAKYSSDIKAERKGHKYKIIKQDDRPDTKLGKYSSSSNSSSSSSNEILCSPPVPRKQIHIVDQIMSQRIPPKEKKPWRRKLQYIPPGEFYEPHKRKKTRKERKVKIPKKTYKEEKYPEEQIINSTDKHKRPKRKKYPEEVAANKLYHRFKDVKHKPKREQKKHPKVYLESTDDSDSKNKHLPNSKCTCQRQKTAATNEDEDGFFQLGRISRWIKHVFKAKQSRFIDEEAGKQNSSASVQKLQAERSSSTDVDKTYTSKRQQLLEFFSPKRLKKAKKFRKDVTPSLQTVISDTDLSSSEVILSAMNQNDLRNRIVTTGDCKKIDDMLVQCDWDRSFYKTHDIETICDKGKDFQHHEPEERRKINSKKILDSQGEVFGILSKGSSTHSLQKVIGNSLYNAESTAAHPRVVSPYVLNK